MKETSMLLPDSVSPLLSPTMRKTNKSYSNRSMKTKKRQSSEDKKSVLQATDAGFDPPKTTSDTKKSVKKKERNSTNQHTPCATKSQGRKSESSDVEKDGNEVKSAFALDISSVKRLSSQMYGKSGESLDGSIMLDDSSDSEEEKDQSAKDVESEVASPNFDLSSVKRLSKQMYGAAGESLDGSVMSDDSRNSEEEKDHASQDVAHTFDASSVKRLSKQMYRESGESLDGSISADSSDSEEEKDPSPSTKDMDNDASQQVSPKFDPSSVRRLSQETYGKTGESLDEGTISDDASDNHSEEAKDRFPSLKDMDAPPNRTYSSKPSIAFDDFEEQEKKESPHRSPRPMQGRGRSERKSITMDALSGSFRNLGENAGRDISASLAVKKQLSKQGVRFSDHVDEKHISVLHKSAIDHMFYASTDFAEFRYEAFMEQCGLDPNEYD
jgi:hypothetical protein